MMASHETALTQVWLNTSLPRVRVHQKVCWAKEMLSFRVGPMSYFYLPLLLALCQIVQADSTHQMPKRCSVLGLRRGV